MYKEEFLQEERIKAVWGKEKKVSDNKKRETCVSDPNHKGEAEFKEVKDSGAREQFNTGSVRDTEDGKGRFDLIPALPLRRIAIHYQNGSKKYGDNNWMKGQRLGRYLSSAERHIQDIKDCKHDEDHLAAVAWNAFAFMWTAEQIKLGKLPQELDDIGWTDDKSN